MNDDHSAPTGNLLRHEVSPYLLQHKDNPVAWRPWGPAALAEAKQTGKPILLSVGYAACHWCHVMAHESFEDAATAAVMNRLFVNIKVDREERPEIDQIYMSALHALGEQGGWPLTMFLTPAGEPIWGGTYFPRVARYGRPAFVDVIEEVARVFADEPDKVAQNRGYLLDRLNRSQEGDGVTLDRPLLDRAASRLLGLIDPTFGGTGGAPKFPNASLFEFLWRAGGRTGDGNYHDAVLLTLRSIANGGIYDHIGGGFARYSVDDRWLVPHFEKMLYDNAQLIELMTFAFLESGDPLFCRRIEETVVWLDREMTTEGGAFAASLDANSEGHEGKFYVWTFEEVIDVLGHEDGARFAETYDIALGGNWEGVSIPNQIGKPALSPEEDRRLAGPRNRLLDRRSTRVRPMTDDKVLADWNGLMIAALALAGSAFGRPDWVAKAEGAFRFVEVAMMRGDRLAHAYRDDKLVFPGLATDYAAMIKAAFALYSATFDHAYLDRAEALAATLRRHHWDPQEPGYFLAADDADALIVRLKSAQDDATPSANSLMAANLIRLWRLTGKDVYREDADALLAASAQAVAGNLFATTGVLNALDLRLGAVDVVIVRPTDADAESLLAAARRHATPNTILSLHEESAELPPAHPAAGKRPVEGRVTAYVCRGEVCSLPVTEADRLRELLAQSP